MSNNHERRSQLIVETFHGDWAEGPAGEFARQAAQHARRRRRLRHAARGVAGVAVALILVLLRPAPSRPVMQSAHLDRAYEIISDDELLAALRDRPVLVLPRENGEKSIVLLDDATGS